MTMIQIRGYLIPGLLLLLFTAYSFYLSRNYILVGVLLGCVFLDFRIRHYLDSKRPSDKFHILQPWRIPDPTTRVRLWLLAGVETLLYFPLFIALAVFVGHMTSLVVLLTPIMAVSVLVLTIPVRYWRMRRQYELPNRDSERGRGSNLTYVGPSDLSRRERTTITVFATVALIAGWIFAPLLWVLWMNSS